MAEFVSQLLFKMAVSLAVQRGEDYRTYLPYSCIVHPDSRRWYEDLLARRRMREHFGMLS